MIAGAPAVVLLHVVRALRLARFGGIAAYSLWVSWMLAEGAEWPVTVTGTTGSVASAQAGNRAAAGTTGAGRGA
jgi:hypothetical protein